jgi:hypothetical protein
MSARKTFSNLASVRARPGTHLDAREPVARAPGVPELTASIAEREQGRAAVEAALMVPYSQEPTKRADHASEGAQARQFGRATFDLLRKRLLAHRLTVIKCVQEPSESESAPSHW